MTSSPFLLNHRKNTLNICLLPYKLCCLLPFLPCNTKHPPFLSLCSPHFSLLIFYETVNFRAICYYRNNTLVMHNILFMTSPSFPCALFHFCFSLVFLLLLFSFYSELGSTKYVYFFFFFHCNISFPIMTCRSSSEFSNNGFFIRLFILLFGLQTFLDFC